MEKKKASSYSCPARMVSYSHAGYKGPLSSKGQFTEQLADNCMETEIFFFHVFSYLLSSA